MKILMFDNEFPPLGGGTGVVNEHILKELSHYPDVYVNLVTSSRSKRETESIKFSERINIYKVPVHNKNIHHASNRELIFYTIRGLFFSKRLLTKGDYDFSFAFAGVPAGFISYILHKTRGLPYYISLQGPDVPGFEARYNYLYPFIKPILRLIWRNAESVIAISEEHKRLALETMPTLDIQIIHNGIDPEEFSPSREPKLETQINFLCVGRLIERKGQHHLIQAVAELRESLQKPLHLNLVGTGDFELKLKQLAVRLGVDDLVTFMGFVPREHMPDVYRKAHIFVLPSENEGMSIALLEAMASGLPVVVTDTGGTKELIKTSINGFVIPWADTEALKISLQRLIEDTSLRKKFGQKNAKIAKNYGWENITKQYLGLFNAIS